MRTPTSKSRPGDDSTAPPADQSPASPSDSPPPDGAPAPADSAPALAGRAPRPGEIVWTHARNPFTNATGPVPVIVLDAHEDGDSTVVEGWRFDWNGSRRVTLELFASHEDAGRYEESRTTADQYPTIDHVPDKPRAAAWWPPRAS